MFSYRSGELVIQSKQAIETEPPLTPEQVESFVGRQHQPRQKQLGIWRDRFGDSFQGNN
jgi:hypothetical protein